MLSKSKKFNRIIAVAIMIGFGFATFSSATIALNKTGISAASMQDQKQLELVYGGYRFVYPKGWRILEVRENDPTIIRYLNSTSSDEDLGDASIIIYNNKDQLSLDKFYDGKNRPNLFEDAKGGYETMQVNGLTGIKFKGVLGYTVYTIDVFSVGNKIYEISDIGEQHQKDGIFDAIIKGFLVANTIE